MKPGRRERLTPTLADAGLVGQVDALTHKAFGAAVAKRSTAPVSEQRWRDVLTRKGRGEPHTVETRQRRSGNAHV